MWKRDHAGERPLVRQDPIGSQAPAGRRNYWFYCATTQQEAKDTTPHRLRCSPITISSSPAGLAAMQAVAQAVQDVVQLFQGAVMDGISPPFPCRLIATLRPSRLARSRSSASRSASFLRGAAALGAWPFFRRPLGQFFGLAHIEPLAHHLPGQAHRIAAGQQGAGMAGRQLALIEHLLDRPAAAPAAAWCWRHGCGSCRRSWPAPLACARIRPSTAGSLRPLPAATDPGAAGSRSARLPAPRGRTGRG